MPSRCHERFCHAIQRSRRAVYASVTAYSVPPSCTMPLMYPGFCPTSSVPMFRNEVYCCAHGHSDCVRQIFLNCFAVLRAPSGLRHPLKYNPIVRLPRPVPVLPRFLLLRTWSSSTE
ncbi:hypothetical protein K523DRAFT_19233 [Schizophyllum commune Tattone D]|nr:hypothetical protein K523DRAFT_19233 [Schizophyllum commune Tattone D]